MSGNPRGGNGGGGGPRGRNHRGFNHGQNRGRGGHIRPRNNTNNYPDGNGNGYARREGREGNGDEGQNNVDTGNQNQAEGPSKKKFDGPVFGFKRLFNFLNKDDADEVISNVYRNLKDWEELLSQSSIAEMKTLRNGSQEMNDDALYLIICILGEKICSETSVLSTKQIAIVNSASSNRNFLTKVTNKCSRFAMDDPSERRRFPGNNEYAVEQLPFKFMQSCYFLFRFVSSKMRSTALDFLSQIVPSTLANVNYLITVQNFNTEEWLKLLEVFKVLKKTMDSIKKEAERKIQEEETRTRRKKYGLTADEEDEQHTMAPPDDFREISVIPSIQELLSMEEAYLRTNKLKGTYSDANHYLDVQFRLLREDFVRPLKNGIRDYMTNKMAYVSRQKKPPIGNVRFYHQVHHLEVKLVRGSMVNTMQLDPSNYQRIRWDKSKRLLTGSLLVFTSDDFESAYFGIVHQREVKDLERGQLAITWEGSQPDFTKENVFLMVECEVYFEAYRHTLQILKEIQLEEFPMKKFIVESSTDVRPPNYLLETRRLMKLGTRYEVSPLNDFTWPTAAELNLDEKQYEAYKACLTKEFVIVQGPPGTGKTFLALQVVEIFLRNPEIWNEDQDSGPILVVTYTNHALDQFLEGIIEVFNKLQQKPSLIRVGGRSKNAALDDYSLIRQRNVASKLQQFDRNYRRMKAEAHEQVRCAETYRAKMMLEMLALNNLQGIVDFNSVTVSEVLQQEFPSELLDEFRKTSWFHLDHEYERERVPDETRLRQWFAIRGTTNQQQQQQRNPNVTVQPTPRPPLPLTADDDSDAEDYDLDELERDRIIEDIYTMAENETISSYSAGSNIRYLYQSVKRERQQEIDGLKKEIDHQRDIRSKNTPKFVIDGQIKSIQADIKDHESYLQLIAKKESFIQTVLNAYKNKTIELPDVSRYCMKQDVYDGQQLMRPVPRTKVEKWAVYFHVLTRAKMLTALEVQKANERLSEAHKHLQDVFNHGDGVLLSRSKIVGMTTTGASKYNALLRKARSRIVIVEEAAEVLESHVVTCLTQNCQHLILIGDHQQLRPSTTVYELAKQYHLDISLFERMVNNNLHCFKINVQHRMRPEIANLVVDTIYPELYNAPNVNVYPKVQGLLTNLFFVSHREAEASESDTKSKSNAHEAKFLASLSRYLIQQGYKPEQITVLTTYTGQMFLIKQTMRKIPSTQGIRVTCVDNFQGEENDIILLSLVRSNNEGQIGFLSIDNRICVAISRAKHGLYIIGNMSNLKSKSKTWRKIDEKLANREEVGTSLTTECQIHGTIQEMTKPEDFQKLSPEGGCLQPCTAVLNCTHPCGMVCHIQDREHKQYRCTKPCLKSCPDGHACRVQCFRKCPPCDIQVTKTLSCGHKLKMPCYEPIESRTCYEQVLRKLPCDHEVTLACFVNPLEFKCRIKVNKPLPCKHIKEMECHVDASDIVCKVIVPKTLPCSHTQEAECWKHEESITCDTIVDYTFTTCDHKTKLKCAITKKPGIVCRSKCEVRLKCGHACSRQCHPDEDPEHLQFECKKPCGRFCDNGEHRCNVKHQCYQPCKPCKILVRKTLPCTHEHEMECQEKVEEKQCQLACRKILSCGHLCKNLCCEPCGPCKEPVKKSSTSCNHEQDMACSSVYTRDQCNVRVPMRGSACGHEIVNVPCRKARTITPEECLKYCNKPCEKIFDEPCGHPCQGSCSKCGQNRIHKKCQAVCGKSNVCGHVCDFPCSRACPPCQKLCEMQCEHSKCKQKCGEPCTGCTEHCQWKCPHKACSKLCSDPCDREPCDEPCPKMLPCGHGCIGFCGEPCPPQCRVCSLQELTEFILYGNEDEEDARFILLEDCNHALEREGMDHYMHMDVTEGEIDAKRCPRCRTLIRKSRRYGNIIKRKLKDVMLVKKKQFGDSKILKKNVQKLVSDIKDQGIAGFYFPEIQKYLLSNLCQEIESLQGVRKTIYREVDAQSLDSLKVISSYLKEAVKVIFTESEDRLGNPVPLKAQYLNLLVTQFNVLFDQLRRRQLPLTKTECEDFDREFDRLFDVKQAYVRKCYPNFTDGHSRAEPIYRKLIDKLQVNVVYDGALKNSVRQLLKELDDTLKTGLGISDRERREILAAIGMQVGRWFKCPNGHVYIITECGGAMEESRCNECGATIGGHSHRLRGDNALATEMDGARAPLYPNMI